MPLANAAAYPIWANALIFLAAAGVIWQAGSRLTRTLDAIAEQSGLDHAFVGMLLLGGITSLPEVANVLTASAIGNPALAVNNLLGSAAINILLLAVGDALVGRRAITSIVAQPSTMMMAVLCMLVLILIAVLTTVGDLGIGPVGAGSLMVGVVSLFAFWLATGHDERSAWTLRGDLQHRPSPPSEAAAGTSRGGSWWRVGLHGALIFLAGYALSQTGDAIAEQAGLTSALVGFALIGTATSLPEMVTILVALKIARPEMAFGQVLGTNFINLALLPLGDLVYSGGPIINSLGTFEVVSALLGALLIGVLLVGLLEHRDRTIGKMGVDSAAVIAIFALGLGLLARI